MKKSTKVPIKNKKINLDDSYIWKKIKQKETLNLIEAAVYLGYKSPWRLALHVKQERIPGKKIAKQWIFHKQTLTDFLKKTNESNFKNTEEKCLLKKRKLVTKLGSKSTASEYQRLIKVKTN